MRHPSYRIFRRLAAGLVLWLAFAITAGAGPSLSPAEDRLMQVTGLDALIEVMRDEGLESGAALEEEYLPQGGGASWHTVVDGIYDTARMRAVFDTAFAGRMTVEELEAAIAFFDTDLGQRIVTLEISTRSALLDPETKAESEALIEDLRGEDSPRLDLLRDFIRVNDLVASNVAGTMNSNLAFYRGMNEGNAFQVPLTEEEMLADVWQQHDAVERDTEDWLYSYLALAYNPLTDAELSAYVDFAETPAGRAFNRATFVAFDAMFEHLARQLGRGLAQFISGHEI